VSLKDYAKINQLRGFNKMSKRFLSLAVLGTLTLFTLGACGLLQEPKEASGPIEAIPLEIDSEEQEGSTQSEPADEIMVEEEQEDMSDGSGSDRSEDEASAADASAADASAADAAVDEEETAPDESSGGLVVFSIDPAQSEVRFEIDEDLRGERNKVVGITDQVAGEIALDRGDLSTVQVGIISINARTLLTDNDFRNRAIQNRILDTGNFEFITFEPKAIEGLPASVAVGESVSFSIIGDLAIRDIVQEATFEIEVTLTSEDEIIGSARTVVSRADYGLNIPSVPNVANVEEEVELYIDFVASG
jgi:polyisoprenoid-binding protein YceI